MMVYLLVEYYSYYVISVLVSCIRTYGVEEERELRVQFHRRLLQTVSYNSTVSLAY